MLAIVDFPAPGSPVSQMMADCCPFSPARMVEVTSNLWVLTFSARRSEWAIMPAPSVWLETLSMRRLGDSNALKGSLEHGMGPCLAGLCQAAAKIASVRPSG